MSLVDLWWADAREPMSGAQETALRAVLGVEERARANRLARLADARRFVFFHAALRAVLGRSTEQSAAAIAFAYGPHGKPRLVAGRSARHVYFNLSHCGDDACIAVSAEAELGVDIEALDPAVDIMAVARNFLSPDERAALNALPHAVRRRAFFGMWTRREAIVKVLGRSLRAEPAQLESAGGAAPLTVCEIGPRADLVGALAVAAERVEVRHNFIASVASLVERLRATPDLT